MASVKWSFSGLKQFTNCPRQYYEVKVQRNFQVRETEQIKYGKEVHKALEDYVRDGTPLAKNYLRFKPMVDALISVDGDKHVEYQMALTASKEPCDFDSPDYWVRGIADLLIVNDDMAFIVDYKTGSARYPDPKQLKLMALMTYSHFPEVRKIKGGLLFVMHNAFITDTYDREDTEDLWGAFQSDLFRLGHAYDNGVWPANPTPLCGWCPVATCEFQKER
jgi:CRISPR/Cas system-associated exonuclease Cas4 (RecB family)